MNKTICNLFKRYSLPRKLVLLADLIITAIGFFIANVLRFNLNVNQISLDQFLIQLSFIILPLYLGAFLLSGSYRGIIRHSSIEDAGKLFLAISAAAMVALLASIMMRFVPVPQVWVLPYSVILIHAAVTPFLLMTFRLIIRGIYNTYMNPGESMKPTLIFGAGELGRITQRILEGDRYSRANVVGFIDDNKALIGKQLAGKQIYPEEEAFGKIVQSKGIREIILAVSRDRIEPGRRKVLFDRCLEHGVSIREVPPVRDWIDGRFSLKQIREVNIEDLLGRDPIWLNLETVAAGLKDAVVLVTGAAGSIGSEIVRQLMAFACRQVILLDQAESPLYDLQNELRTSFPNARFGVEIANVTDRSRIRRIFEKYRPQYVFNAAAYKHVPLMEATPYEAIRTNVGGTCHLADLSVEFRVKKFVMISTDKAVNPTNVMGASKRICEIYIQALARLPQMKTQFITTRFGNVLGSNGSVVPLFRKQIEAGGPITVTHPDIIRYFMTIPEACHLVLEAGFMGQGGEIYVFDMGEPVKIYDLAVKMISLAGLKPEVDIPIVFTGLRPGEKLYEELLADTENTISTHHPKIKVARVREHDFDLVKLAVDELLKAAQTEPDTELVLRMKALVPEYASRNSKFCKLDKVAVEK